MNCPNRPTDLDLLLAGEPTDARVREHAETCTACASEVALARQIDAALASRRTVTAPPEVIAAALAEVRRTPTHRALAEARPATAGAASGARTSRPLWRTSAFAFAAVLAFALAWTALRAPEPSTETVVAENEATEPLAEPTPVVTPADDPEVEPTAPEAEASETDTPEAAAPAPRRAAPRQRPRQPVPQPRTPASPVDAEAAPDAAIAQNDAPEAAPTPEDIARARDDLQLAFALIGDAQRQAGRAVRAEGGALSTAIDQTIPF